MGALCLARADNARLPADECPVLRIFIAVRSFAARTLHYRRPRYRFGTAFERCALERGSPADHFRFGGIASCTNSVML